MASKYLKNDEGIVRAITTNNLKLEKPMLNENYDIDVHNRNMDKIDNAIQEVKGKVDGLELNKASLENSINENKAKILENKTNLDNLKTRVDNGQNHRLTSDNGTYQNISNKDLDTITKTGYYVGHTLGNAPNTYWYYVDVKVRDSSYIYQQIITCNDSNMTKYERVMRNGAWENWRCL